jgi:hypothetical protein
MLGRPAANWLIRAADGLFRLEKTIPKLRHLAGLVNNQDGKMGGNPRFWRPLALAPPGPAIHCFASGINPRCCRNGLTMCRTLTHLRQDRAPAIAETVVNRLRIQNLSANDKRSMRNAANQ